MPNTKRERVLLEKIIDEFKLDVVYAPENIGDIWISCSDVHRPGIQLAAEYYDYFDCDRIQVIGKAEHFYLLERTEEERLQILMTLCAKKIPAIVVTRSLEIFPELLTAAKKYNVAVLRTEDNTSGFVASYINTMNVMLAPFITRHGVLM